MKKLISLTLVSILIAGCSSTSADSIYSDNELDILDAYGVADEAQNDCDNQETVKKMLQSDFKKSNLKKYCSLKVDNVNGLNDLIDANLKNKEIEEYESIKYFDSHKLDRYLKYDAKTIKDKVLSVNMNLDLTPYDDAVVLTSIDKSSLINKYNKISKDYEPKELVEVDSVCKGDINCQDTIEVEANAASAFDDLVSAASDEDIEIYACAGYMDENAQEDYYLNVSIHEGSKYANDHVAKAGYSDLGSGYGLVIDIKGVERKELEDSKKYKWLKDNLDKYGFIVRYEKGKEDETGYEYSPLQIHYVGLDLADKLTKNDMSLEYYYATK